MSDKKQVNLRLAGTETWIDPEEKESTNSDKKRNN